MPLIYEPRGPAGEYAPLAANLYKGCGHGCQYCYVPGVLRTDRDEFRESPRPKGGGDGTHILEQLDHEAARLRKRGDKRPILLSFTTDPYQECEQRFGLTRNALKLLGDHGLRAILLTKGWCITSADLARLSRDRHIFGVSLTGAAAEAVEPFAAPQHIRIDHLREARRYGISTWASLEPVIWPRDSLAAIREAAPFCGHFAVGKLNHDDPPMPVDWKKFREEAEILLQGLGYHRVGIKEAWGKPSGTYYLKRDLLVAAR